MLGGGWESLTETWLGLRAKQEGLRSRVLPEGHTQEHSPKGQLGQRPPTNDQSATELPNKTVLVIPAISEKGEHRTATKEQKEQMCVFY